MISIAEIISTTYTATGDTPIRANLIADTLADLPTPTGIAGYILQQGSTATVIADSTRYAMQSDGTWIQQLSTIIADTYTRQQIDALINALQVEIDTKAVIADFYGTGRQIQANDTMDDPTLGKFYCANSATAQTVTNPPWTDSGWFGHTERSISSANRYVQIAIKNDAQFNVAKRRYTGTWEPWAYITSQA